MTGGSGNSKDKPDPGEISYCPPDIFSSSSNNNNSSKLESKSDSRSATAKNQQPKTSSAIAAAADEASQQKVDPQPAQPQRPTLVKSFHLALFALVLFIGVLFLSLLLYVTADINLQRACITVVRRLLKTVALRQVAGILGAMLFLRLGLEPLAKALRNMFQAREPWEKSREYHILREIYHPMETLFIIAAFTTMVENFLPQLISIPRATVQNVVRSTLSLAFVLASARVVFNIKGRILREETWKMELTGDLTKQRRIEAINKLMSVMTLLVASIFGLQAVGLDVNSVLAIGGVGGLAIGLAGREILENLFTGLIILSSSPFEVGEEVLFTPPTGPKVEGIVLDVGWYRTTIRSFEREIYAIPNSVFSRNVVLNVTRKGSEWRFFEFIGLQVDDVSKAAGVVYDMRRVFRQDVRIIQKLHRRVFIDKIIREQVTIYLSAYIEASNRDAFMAVKQDLLLAFVDCCNRNGARLSRKRTQVEVVTERGAVTVSSPSKVEGSPATTSSDNTPAPASSRGGEAIGLMPMVLSDVTSTTSSDSDAEPLSDAPKQRRKDAVSNNDSSKRSTSAHQSRTQSATTPMGTADDMSLLSRAGRPGTILTVSDQTLITASYDDF